MQSQSYFRQCCHRKLASSFSTAWPRRTIVFVGNVASSQIFGLLSRLPWFSPVVDGVRTAVAASARTGRVLAAGSAREDRFSDVCYVGDTRSSFSEKKRTTASCALVISVRDRGLVRGESNYFRAI